jgi:hypothetical protein
MAEQIKKVKNNYLLKDVKWPSFDHEIGVPVHSIRYNEDDPVSDIFKNVSIFSIIDLD